MPEIITRAEAKARGLKRYFSGKPCRHGHIEERLLSGGCVVCNRVRVKNNIKAKRKTKKGIEQEKRWRAGYRRRNYSKLQEKWRAYQKKNRELINFRAREKWKNDEAFRERRMKKHERWKQNGPIKPRGELQWLSKNKALLRRLRQVLRNQNQDHSNLLNVGLPT